MDITKIISKIAEKEGWDIANEYGEPGYHGTPVIGYYWKHDKDGKLYGYFDGHPRIEAALDAAGYELEWSDEWVIDWDGDGKAWRTQGDSYFWQPSTHYDECGDLLTPDTDIETWTDEMKNSDRKALNSAQVKPAALEAAGWTRWPADGDPGDEYQNGWHQGMDDKPEDVMRQIRHDLGDTVDVVFHIHETSQFYISFRAWVRPIEQDTEDEG